MLPKTIPIVMMGGGLDPVEAGLVDSLARPGGNVTGITLLSGNWAVSAELLKDRFPNLPVLRFSRSDQPPTVREVKEVLPVPARALGLTIQPWEVRTADGFEKVFAALKSSARMDSTCPAPCQWLLIKTDRRFGKGGYRRYGNRGYVERRLISYGADIADSNRRAYYVDRIQGAKPADLPVSNQKFELVIIQHGQAAWLNYPLRCA
jgi:putative ABC transport system substrate-binding protein